jgi:ubiquinone/menaquinone biosynthesis C-methylase UbiE
MEQSLEQIREQQKETWNKFSPGWKKWDEFTMDFLSPMGEAIIRALHPVENDTVLDVATGTGEPGLTIARITSKGKVIGTDLSEGMLAIARDQAKAQGLENFDTIACDVSELPFPDNFFDGVSCRFGFMFFPDMLLAAKEMARVLKPGGRISTSIWGEAKSNAWITAMMGPINEVLQLQPQPQGAPGIFRCAGPGMMEELFKKAGFRNIISSDVSGEHDFLSQEMFWSFHTEVVAPVVAAMSKATDDQKQTIRSKVEGNLRKLNPSGGAKLKYAAGVISAEK